MAVNPSPLEVELGASLLTAVPAVHFRVAFAEEVNRICSNPSRRPDAIAVELGPITAAAVGQWLAELGIGPAQRRRLPLMLGLMKPNRYLKPSVRERALELQRETGVALRDLPAEVVQRELGYSCYGTLMISPTDSIIEAIRCGCELGVPVYGVDLEEMAEPQYEGVLIADPSGARGRVADYVADNQEFAQGFDEEIDPRRETAMAARLKALLGRHARVLFTCGMAHWPRVYARLQEPALRPALIPEPPTDAAALGPFERVAVDPRIAARYLDRLPAIARIYERQRSHPLLGSASGHRAPDPKAVHGRLLRKVYRCYFGGGEDRADWGAQKRRDWVAAPAFEQMLDMQTQLSMRALPTSADIHACARATMSGDFCEVLSRTLMGPRWVEPGQHGAAAGLEPARRANSGGDAVMLRGGRHDGEAFPLKTLPGQSMADNGDGAVLFDAPSSRDGSQDKESGFFLCASRYSWVPWDNLVSGLSAQAFRCSGKGARTPVPEEFGGQLLEGIDVKATLRAQARGEEKLFVRNSRSRPSSAVSDPTERFPVVWLFDADPAVGECEFECYYEHLSATRRHARDPERFRRVAREKGDGAVAVIAFGQDQDDDLAVEESDASMRRFDLRGAVFFMPLFPGRRQFARWFERTNFERNPFGSCLGSGEVTVEGLNGSSGAASEPLRWQDKLVCAAIPYGRGSVTVVVPPAFRLAPKVYQHAARHGVAIWTAPLDRLPAHHVARLRRNYMVTGRFDDEIDTVIYSAEGKRAIGEPLDRYLDLVPAGWRTFGLD